MRSFIIKLRTISMFSLGWTHPVALGPDVPFTRRPTRNGSWELYIPGYSLKGALRSSASRIAETYGFKSCSKISPKLIKSSHNANNLCDVCYIFGMPGGWQPKFFFHDLTINQQLTVKTLTLTRIRIEDKSLKVAEGGLFASELIEPNIEFKGRIDYHNMDKKKMGLLLLAIAELRLGRIGRSSLADIKIENTNTLKEDVDQKWHPLIKELGEWLWD